MPPLITRMVVDFQVEQPVRVYYQCYADARMVEGKDVMALIDSVEKEPVPGNKTQDGDDREREAV